MDAGTCISAFLQSSPLNPLETRVLLQHALGWSRIELITRSEHPLTVEEAALLSSLVQRRLGGEPIAYIVGTREFYSLSFEVTPAVLIPRPETELLVELAMQFLPFNGSVLDMGTGSGAIAIAIAHTRPDAVVTALDIRHPALEVADRNAHRHNVNIEFVQSDWFVELGDRKFDLIISNPPYIIDGDHHLSEGDLRFEPLDALTDHGDGLSAIRTILSHANKHLTSHGSVFIEHGYDQAIAVRQLLLEYQFIDVQSWRDLAGIERVSGGTMQHFS